MSLVRSRSQSSSPTSRTRARPPETALPWSAKCPHLLQALDTHSQRPASAGSLRRSLSSSTMSVETRSPERIRRSTDKETKSRRFQSLLLNVGYNWRFEEALAKESVASSLASLRHFAEETHLEKTIVSELEAELYAGTAKLTFFKNRQVQRYIVLQALQLYREPKNEVLIHVGTWHQTKGMRVTCFLPGGKQEAGLAQSKQLADLVRGELSWLLYKYNLHGEKTNVHFVEKASDRYGISTKYEKIICEALAVKRNDLDRQSLDDMKATYAPLVVDFYSPRASRRSNDEHAAEDNSSDSGSESLPSGGAVSEAEAEVSGEMSLTHHLWNTPASGVVRSLTEIALYAWVHPDIWALKVKEDKQMTAAMKAWGNSFKEGIESYMGGMAFLNRGSDDFKLPQYAPVKIDGVQLEAASIAAPRSKRASRFERASLGG